MPATNEKISWNFRIDRHPVNKGVETKVSDDTFQSQFSAFFGLKMYNIAEKIVVMKEYATETLKLHYHANIVFRQAQKYGTIHKWFNEAFPFHTGSTKSCAFPKKKTNLSYICKDKSIVFQKGYDKDEIHRIGDQWIRTPEEKKKNAVTTITAIIEEKYDEMPWDITDVIITTTVEYYAQRKCAVQRFMMYAVMDGVRLQLDKETVTEEIKSGYMNYSQK